MSDHKIPGYKQLRLFNIDTGEDVTDITGIVYKLPNGKWQAMIGDGWYIGYGSSRKVAINNAIKSMEKEAEGLG